MIEIGLVQFDVYRWLLEKKLVETSIHQLFATYQGSVFESCRSYRFDHTIRPLDIGKGEVDPRRVNRKLRMDSCWSSKCSVVEFLCKGSSEVFAQLAMRLCSDCV